MILISVSEAGTVVYGNEILRQVDLTELPCISATTELVEETEKTCSAVFLWPRSVYLASIFCGCDYSHEASSQESAVLFSK